MAKASILNLRPCVAIVFALTCSMVPLVNAFAQNFPAASDGDDAGKCPYTSSIEQILTPIRDGDEFERTVSFLETGKLRFLKASATKGDRMKNYLASIRTIHYTMRENYKEMIQEVGKNIYPLIIASDTEPEGSVSGVGGTFTLYLEDGTIKTIKPTSYEFEALKNLAHIPLGIFSIISAYFSTPESKGWVLPIQDYQNKILQAISASNLVINRNNGMVSKEFIENSQVMLNISYAYTNSILGRGFITIPGFERYTKQLFPYVNANIKRAAALQVQAILPRLQEWKQELGDDKWKDVHALIPTIWPVSAINPRLQLLAQVMSPEQIKTQVFMLENGGNILQQRETLGRIVADRAAALLILGTKTKEQQRLTFALSSRQDLLANYCQDAINEYLTQSKP